MSVLVSIITISLINIFPFFRDVADQLFFLNKLESGYVGRFVVITSMILGFVVIFLYLFHLFAYYIPTSIIQTSPLLKLIFFRRTIRHDTSMKQASSYKVNRMINNAFKLHKIEDGYKTSLLKFVQDREHETIGGVRWVYKKAWDHTLFMEEGIWMSSRLKGCLMCNFIIVILILLYGIDYLQDIYDPTNDTYDYQV